METVFLEDKVSLLFIFVSYFIFLSSVAKKILPVLAEVHMMKTVDVPGCIVSIIRALPLSLMVILVEEPVSGMKTHVLLCSMFLE